MSTLGGGASSKIYGADFDGLFNDWIITTYYNIA